MNYNDPETGRRLLEQIHAAAAAAGPIRIMEVCGTHTMAVGRFGIRRLLPDTVRLISGPGCPVCVTPSAYIDNAIRLGLEHDLTVATFGDMVRVPGAEMTLEKARSEGARVSILTTPLEILAMQGEVLFLAVGFETTAAPIAAAMEAVLKQGRKDVFFYTSLKVVPPTLQLLLADEAIGVNGFLLPGHVSAIIGADAYRFLNVPSCIAGFEMLDILDAVLAIVIMQAEKKTEVYNRYGRVVTAQGNPKANNLLDKYLEPCDQAWRGLGVLPGCSLSIREEFSQLDAEKHYGLELLDDAVMPGGCSCGDVLKGTRIPSECPLFADQCTPDNPVGPCMVSSEGSCAAYYKYERQE